MELSASDLWTRILEAARPHLPEQSFRTWLAGTRATGITGDELSIEVPGPFHAEWIEDKFGEVLRRKSDEIVGRPLELTFRPAEDAPPLPEVVIDPQGSGGPEGSAAAGSRGEARADAARAPTTRSRPAAPEGDLYRDLGLNRRYSFDRFVVGTNNQLAWAACKAVAEKPARIYNPLFLYGGVGLGKTHLMHAIGSRVLEGIPGTRVFYVPAEQFMNELVTAIQEGTTADFRRRYRLIDLLLVDDIHFLEGKERTQDEFFHTFNALYDAQKQIVVTSDRPPKELPGLEERLVSRFEWGLVADIKPPDYETRIAILRKKAADDGITLDGEVIDFIARACTSSVRELEGAVIKLLAYSSLKQREITTALAREALAGAGRGDRDHAALVPQDVKDEVARAFGVRSEALASKRRTKDLTVPRQVAMYLIRDLLDIPLVQIGEVFGGRDHSTVIHSIRKVEEEMEQDGEFRERVTSLRDSLQPRL